MRAPSPFRAVVLVLVLPFVFFFLPDAVRAGDRPPLSPTLPVEELTLANGLRFLLLPRPGTGTVEAGWLVRAGAADEPPGAGGAAHAVEHLLFQGTRTIAARDPAAELSLLEREDSLQEELARLAVEAATPELASGRLARLRARLQDLTAEATALVERLRALILPGEFSLRYSQVGATGLDANTAHDFTLFYVTLPAEALELWFWLESDRLLDPVFREFEREKAVIAEERRLRVDSTPTGAAEEALAARFWGAGAYGSPTVGSPEALAGLRRPAARRFFAERYSADRITAALVGDFDPGAARSWAERYFGRLGSGAPPPLSQPVAPLVADVEPWTASCACPDQAQLLYRTVPLDHPDTTALQLLASLFNGRSGRLYRSLVVERGLAFAAFAQQTPYARAGAFEVTLEAKGGHDPDELVAAWDQELEALIAAPIAAPELERARNVLAAEALRQLREPSQLLRRLLIYDALGGWRLLADWPERLRRVSEGEVRVAARRYLAADRRLVAVFRREGAAG